MSNLQQERNQLLLDIWEGRKPKRVPVTAMVSLEYALQYKGYSLFCELYSPKHCFEAADEMASLINSDNLPVMPETMAAVHRYSMNRHMVPGKDGFFQHPNYSPMEFAEYPRLIEDPVKFWAQVIRPRIFGILEEDPQYGELRLAMANKVVSEKYIGMGTPELVEKYERTNIEAVALLSLAPYDYIADVFRSFTDICIDIRRRPEWVLDACEAMLVLWKGMLENVQPVPGKINTVTLPLHMAPYMNRRDFDKFYFPSFKKLIQMIQDHGFHAVIYCEENWDPHLEALNDLPGRVHIGFEKADPKKVVETLDKRHIISHFFDTHILRSATPGQVSDEVKRLLDIVAVNGNYIFAPNKPCLVLGDARIENIQAMVETALEYGVY
ncbi:MAG TPA: hypothetical protein GXZ53_04080 [Firmicutes bacterium]|jgi:uroporphyrinogen-III decarboxylase|nr:hypothetical protein [Bacillota bacterium]